MNTIRRIYFMPFLLVAFSTLAGCKTREAPPEREALSMSQAAPDIQAYIEANGLNPEVTASGLYYIIEKEGIGEFPTKGDKVEVHYTGRLLNGKIFDSSLKRGTPLPFTIGIGQVIQGWDEGMMLFREGGGGVLIIPAELAYGETGFPGLIPPNSPLIFDVALVKVNK